MNTVEVTITNQKPPEIENVSHRYTRKHVIVTTAVDILIAVILFVAYDLCRRHVPDPVTGYFCSEMHIRLPERSSGIKYSFMVIAGFVVNCLTIVGTELQNQPIYSAQSSWFFRRQRFPVVYVNIYNYMAIFIFGIAAQIILTLATTKTIARLAPYFFEACKPTPNNGLSCSQPRNYLKYIEDFQCENGSYKLGGKDMYHSFPCVYSAMSMYLTAYFALYLQYRLDLGKYNVVKHALQLIALLLGTYVGINTLANNLYHWEDVAVGFFIGTIANFGLAFIEE